MLLQYNTKATSWVGNIVTWLQSVHVRCVTRKLMWRLKFTHTNEEKSSLIEGYALFKAQGFIKRHKTTRICYLQTRIIDPTRLDSILTAYLNILAVLDSFISIYTLYKTKTQIIITGTHVLTPWRAPGTFKHVATNMYACTHLHPTLEQRSEMLHDW